MHAYCYRYAGFLPPKAVWGNIAPTWNDGVYRHEVLQVRVTADPSTRCHTLHMVSVFTRAHVLAATVPCWSRRRSRTRTRMRWVALLAMQVSSCE
jgi:hypothetical protein